MRMREQDFEREKAERTRKCSVTCPKFQSPSSKRIHRPCQRACQSLNLSLFLCLFFLPLIASILKIQDLTSRLDLKINLFRSLMFYSSDFCWFPFALNVRELSYLKNLVHPGTVYSTSSVDSNPSSNFFIDHLLCFGTLYIACKANLQLPSFPNLLYWSPLLSFVHSASSHSVPHKSSNTPVSLLCLPVFIFVQSV